MPPTGAPPQTLARALAWARGELAAASASAALDAEVLLLHCIGRERAYLRAWPEHALTADQLAAFTRQIGQRRAGWPVAYLTGEREFWSRSFRVDPAVLIPRHETELLIELALELIPKQAALDLLDLGAGSGIIAITLAAERPASRVTALDASPAALRIAEENAARLGVTALRLLCGDWFAPLGPADRYDLIVSNPPYIATGDPHLQAGDLRFEPALALASGADGLDALRQIAAGARQHLKPGGTLLLEHGHDQAGPLAALLAASGYQAISHHTDLQGQRRAIMARYGAQSRPEGSLP